MRLNKAQAIKRDNRVIKQLFVAFLFCLLITTMLLPGVCRSYDDQRNNELLQLKCQTSLCTEADYAAEKQQ